MKINFLRKNLLAVHPGPGTLQALKLVRKKKKTFMEDHFHSRAPGFTLDGSSHQWQRFTELLIEITEQCQLWDWPAAIALPVQLCKIKTYCWTEKLTRTELPKKVQGEITAEFSPGTQLALDFTALENVNGKQDIHVAATKAEYVIQCQRAFKTAGLRLRLIDIDAYALSRTVLQAIAKTKDTLYVVLYYQHRHAWLIWNPDYIVSCSYWHSLESSADLIAKVNHFMTLKLAEVTARAIILVACGETAKVIRQEDVAWAAEVMIFSSTSFLQTLLEPEPVPDNQALLFAYGLGIGTQHWW